MSSYIDRIKPDANGITTYIDDLLNKKYQIPTFQRNVVWDEDNVKKLWDSVYKFYPLGSILIWKTPIKLQNYREIGGHKITDPNVNLTEYQYILDGQQRTTALLTSLYGGKIEDKPGFNPTLYIDLTIDSTNYDDDLYRKRFLFWKEIDDNGGKIQTNSGKMKKFNEGLIVKLIDISKEFNEVEKKLHDTGYTDFNHPYRENFRRIREVLANYRIAFIILTGIKVAEVCQIFERINREGKPLGIYDILVAKTYRPQTESKNEFYLRKLVDDFKNLNDSKYLEIDDLSYLQILAIIIGRVRRLAKSPD